MEFKIDHGKLARQVWRDLELCESFARHIKDAAREIEDQPFERDPGSLCEQIRYNQQMGRLYLERAVAALELVGLFDEDAGDCVDIKTVLEKLRDLADGCEEPI